MVDKVVLYSYFRSSASWRVRIALAIKGINYEYRAVNLIKDEGEQYSEEYVKLNPMSQVPSLLIDGHCLIQSVRAIAEIMNSGIQPLHNLKILQQVGDEKVAWARTHIEHGLKAIERALATTAGTYSYGDQVTIADICLVPQVYAAKRFKIDMSQYPIISRVNDVLVEIPAFKAADAFRQPDTPEDLRVV